MILPFLYLNNTSIRLRIAFNSDCKNANYLHDFTVTAHYWHSTQYLPEFSFASIVIVKGQSDLKQRYQSATGKGLVSRNRSGPCIGTPGTGSNSKSKISVVSCQDISLLPCFKVLFFI